jgi:hypothetical protein
MNKLVCLLFISMLCWSCTHNSGTEKHQGKRDKIVNVRDKVKEIVIPEEDVMIGSFARLYLMGDYLIIGDYNSPDKYIHLLDKNRFGYVTDAAYKGQGPGEITSLGHIGVDEANRMFYVTDHGKQRIFGFDLDSVLANPSYMPEVKMKMVWEQFPDDYQYINDTLSMGVIVEPIGNTSFKQKIAKWNMNTGEIKPMPYEHPDIEKKRVGFAMSTAHGIYVECYHHYDLITICSLDGALKYNIYGRRWDSRTSNRVYHYGNIAFCNDRIIISYSGGDYMSDEYFPTKFHIFDLTGDYIQTLETGYRIQDFCYDKENNRIIMALNDDIQFAYLELDGLIE